MNATADRARATGVMPSRASVPGSRIHQLYSTRQLRGAVLLTMQCGQVFNLDDVTSHDIGPTCKRCRLGGVIR